MNIIDYVKCSSQENKLSPYNMKISDTLVLTALSYIDFSVVSENLNEKTKLSDAINQMFSFGINQKYEKFLINLRNSKRFSNLYISGYRNEYDNLSNPMQFSVITIQISDSLHFISYSGTDGTVVGWKEDFQFSYLTQTPAQNKALEYLKEAADSLGGHFIISGHSKGGNLAAYASIFIGYNIRKRINSVFCNDAPGFNRDVDILTQEGYFDIENRIHCILPQDSMIGQLLQVFPEKHSNIIFSNSENLLYQHDIFTWQIDDAGNPKWLKNINKRTEIGMKKINNLISNLSMNQRENFTDFIFDILETQNIKHIDALKSFIPLKYFKI